MRFPKRNYLWLGVWLFTILISDQLTKSMIMSRFHLGESISIIPGFFNLTLVHNPGAAFGFLANLDPSWREPFFLAVPTITLAVILFLLHRLRDQQAWSRHAFSLIVAGAVGNLIDRLRFGYVVDFLDFHWQYTYHFPAFNVADSAISAGVGLLVLATFLEKPLASHSR